MNYFNRAVIAFLLLLCVLCGFSFAVEAGGQPDARGLVPRIVSRLKSNSHLDDGIGTYQKVTITRLDDSGKAQSKETRLYHTIWIYGLAFSELLQVDGKSPGPQDAALEARRKSELTKAYDDSKSSSGRRSLADQLKEIPWEEIAGKYDLRALPVEYGAAHVISFRPREADMKERNRVEKVLNKVAGKAWLDGSFNVLRVEAHLTDDVTFGWGIFGNVNRADVRYSQQRFAHAWLPETLTLRVRVRAGFRTVHQLVEISWFDPYSKATSLAKEAVPPAGPSSPSQ